MKHSQQKNNPPVSLKITIVAFGGLIVILTLFMLREIYPENPFIIKYFNKGYLIIEVLIFIGILWGIDIWRTRRKEKSKKTNGL
jgi:hypothetical protein